MSERNILLVDIFTCISFVTYLLFSGTTLGDPGIGWHIKTGQWIFENLEIPYTDLFSYSTHDTIWISNQWLSDLLLWSLYALGGFPLLHLWTCILCIMTPLYIFCKYQSKVCTHTLFNLIIYLLMIGMLKIQWFTRPVIFSFLFFAVMLIFFFSKKEITIKDIFKICILFFLWANTHPAFVLGLAFILIYSLVIAFYKLRTALRLAITATLAFLCTLINPYGYLLHWEIIKLINNPFFMKLNLEWLPPDLSSIFIPFYISIGTFIITICYVYRNKEKISDFPWLLSTGLTTLIFLLLSTNSRRYIPFYAIISTAFITFTAGNIKTKKSSLFYRIESLADQCSTGYKRPYLFIFLSITFSAYSLLLGHLPFRKANYSFFANQELENCLRKVSTSKDIRILNHPDFGGQISFFFYPQKAIYIDDRNELHGELKYQTILEQSKLSRLNDTIGKFKVNYVLMPQKVNFEDFIKRSGVDYQKIYCSNDIDLFEIFIS